MEDDIVIEHTVFDSPEKVDLYYTSHPMVLALDANWGLIRVEYPEGIYDNCIIFAVISTITHMELDIPRAVLPVSQCSKDKLQFFKYMTDVEKQPEGPVERIVYEYTSHIVFDSFDEVKEHFKNNPECTEEEDMVIYRIADSESSIHPDYKKAHIFIAFNLSTHQEMNVPRAVLPKSKCNEKDDDEIQMIEYIYYDDDDIEKILSAEDQDKSLTPDGPDEGDNIN